jgi:hypothetical protein
VARGAAQVEAAAALLAERVAAILAGGEHDPFADLRAFVERYWPERLLLGGRAGRVGGEAQPAILITNPGPVSRYLSGLDLQFDGVPLSRAGLTLVNATVGEAGTPISAAELGPERGFYVRRLQTAELTLPGEVAPGPHRVELSLSLAGVTEAAFAETVDFA